MKLKHFRILSALASASAALVVPLQPSFATTVFHVRVVVTPRNLRCSVSQLDGARLCDLILLAEDPLTRRIRFLRSLFLRAGVPDLRVGEGLLELASRSPGNAVPADLKITRIGSDQYHVELRFLVEPRVRFDGTATDRIPQNPPPLPPCTSGCCNSWCGTGQV